MLLEKNQLAPAFAAPNQENRVIALSDYLGKTNVVLYFYLRFQPVDATHALNRSAGVS